MVWKENHICNLWDFFHQCWGLHVCNCFFITILNNLFWCESVGSKNPARVVWKIVGVTVILSLVICSISTWFAYKKIWASIEPSDCNLYRMPYWSMVPNILGPHNKISCMNFSAPTWNKFAHSIGQSFYDIHRSHIFAISTISSSSSQWREFVSFALKVRKKCGTCISKALLSTHVW